MRPIILVCALTASGAGAASPSKAPPLPLFVPGPEAPLPKGSPVSVHFAPPLEAPIRYLREETDAGGTYRREIVLRFQRTDGGYRMEASSPGETADLPPPLQVALQPIGLLLDADGTLTGLADPDAYWTASDVLLARGTGSEWARLKAATQALRGLDPVTAAYAVAGAYAPATLMSRLEVRVGDVMRIPAHPAYNSAVPEERLTHSLEFDPASATRQRLRMEIRSEYDAEGSARIAERLGGEAAVARLKAEGGHVVETSVHELEPATGLALRHESRFILVGRGREEVLRAVRLTRSKEPVVK